MPLTRPKSPKLSSSRRKSCNDAINSSQEQKEGVCDRTQRHSLGSYKEGNTSATPKSKGQIARRYSVGSNGNLKPKVERAKEEKENTNEAGSDTKIQANVDITIKS